MNFAECLLCHLSFPMRPWAPMAEALMPQGRLNLPAAAGLHADLLERANQDITVDMSSVTQIGALCLQVLIAAGKTACAAGNTMQLININDTVRAQLGVMGMTPETIVEGSE